MAGSTERAVLAGGCFWGMQGLIRRYPGVISTRVGYTGGEVPNATYRNHGNHAEAIEIIFDPAKISYRQVPGVLLSDPRSDDPQPPGQRHRRKLSLGDLHNERRAEARSFGHHRRRQRLGPMARQGRDGSRARGSVLGSRARAPGLSRTLSEWLYVPLRPPQLGSAEAGRCGIDGLQLRRRPFPARRPFWFRAGILTRGIWPLREGSARVARDLPAREGFRPDSCLR